MKLLTCYSYSKIFSQHNHNAVYVPMSCSLRGETVITSLPQKYGLSQRKTSII